MKNYFFKLRYLSRTPEAYGAFIAMISSSVGVSELLKIISSWFRVDVPAKSGLPESSSPIIHPIDHISIPVVYL